MNNFYKQWIRDLKQKILSAQIKARLTVNRHLIQLYWEVGSEIIEKQETQNWGSKVVEQVAIDLKKELPDTVGFSRTNLYEMRRFVLFYRELSIVHQLGGQLEIGKNAIVQQLGGQLPDDSVLCRIPWRHHIEIIRLCNEPKDALFYIEETIKNNWSRTILSIQIETELHKRQGRAQNNFETTKPKLFGDLAKETLKDPYTFDFLNLRNDVQELELERELIDNIAKFLIELGKGFAYVGRQYPIIVGGKERRIDLLFNHLKIHCYVVIDLKMGEFEPEFVGKMSYYLSAVDDLIKTDVDQHSIGLILCKTKNSIDVEYSLRGMINPMGVSEFKFNELPELIQNNLPSEEELNERLRELD